MLDTKDQRKKVSSEFQRGDLRRIKQACLPIPETTRAALWTSITSSTPAYLRSPKRNRLESWDIVLHKHCNPLDATKWGVNLSPS